MFVAGLEMHGEKGKWLQILLAIQIFICAIAIA